MAGHSKWANIKHRKGRQDAKRSKLWSKCSRAIIVAAKNGGGDPDTNLALRYAIDEAKAQNMPKDTIENAIKKGTGQDETTHYEEVVYEGYGPAGVAVMLDVMTDNRNRTAPEVRKLFERHGGNLGATGCVAYNFTQKGQLLIPKDAAGEEQLMDVGLDAGLEEITDEGDAWQVLCEAGDFLALREAIENAGIAVEAASITMIPGTTVEVAGRDAEKTLALMEELEDHDDVQHVYANFDIPEGELAALE